MYTILYSLWTYHRRFAWVEGGPLVDLPPHVGDFDLDLFGLGPNGHAAVLFTPGDDQHRAPVVDACPGLAGGPVLLAFGPVPLVGAPQVVQRRFVRLRFGFLPLEGVRTAQTVETSEEGNSICEEHVHSCKDPGFTSQLR